MPTCSVVQHEVEFIATNTRQFFVSQFLLFCVCVSLSKLAQNILLSN